MLKIIGSEDVYLPDTTSEVLGNAAERKKANQKLANIAFWALRQLTVSSRKIQEQFRMGKSADSIVENLVAMGIASEKFFNQPRRVLPVCLDDLPDETLSFLEKYGHTINDVAKALNSKIISDENFIDFDEPQTENLDEE
jgi:hypothetical protein